MPSFQPLYPADVAQGQIPSPSPDLSRPEPAAKQKCDRPPTIYIIRHGEKNPEPKPGDVKAKDSKPLPPPLAPITPAEGIQAVSGFPLTPIDPTSDLGLNQAGVDRAYRLPYVFNDRAETNPFDIRYIIAMQPAPGGGEERPFQTIWPLALSLLRNNNYCSIDTTVLRDATAEAARRIQNFIEYSTSGNILVSWEHHHLADIVTAFGFENAPQYPEMFDVVWVLQPTLEPDGKTSKWSYKTIKWLSERTAEDVHAGNEFSPNNNIAWRTQARTPKDDVKIEEKTEAKIDKKLGKGKSVSTKDEAKIEADVEQKKPNLKPTEVVPLPEDLTMPATGTYPSFSAYQTPEGGEDPVPPPQWVRSDA